MGDWSPKLTKPVAHSNSALTETKTAASSPAINSPAGRNIASEPDIHIHIHIHIVHIHIHIKNQISSLSAKVYCWMRPTKAATTLRPMRLAQAVDPRCCPIARSFSKNKNTIYTEASDARRRVTIYQHQFHSIPWLERQQNRNLECRHEGSFQETVLLREWSAWFLPCNPSKPWKVPRI